MSFRVVLYGEGPGDLGDHGDEDPQLELTEDDLGPLHHLVRRMLCERSALPEAAVRFRWRYRDRRGRAVRGSRLLHQETRAELAALHRLNDADIDLVVVAVDRDGEVERTPGWLAEPFAAMGVPVAAGVAREEFEAWLMGDARATSARLGSAPPSAPELLAPSEAKAWLASHAPSDGTAARGVRSDLARTADLDAIARSCPSFKHFRAALTDRASTARPG